MHIHLARHNFFPNELLPLADPVLILVSVAGKVTGSAVPLLIFVLCGPAKQTYQTRLIPNVIPERVLRAPEISLFSFTLAIVRSHRPSPTAPRHGVGHTRPSLHSRSARAVSAADRPHLMTHSIHPTLRIPPHQPAHTTPTQPKPTPASCSPVSIGKSGYTLSRGRASQVKFFLRCPNSASHAPPHFLSSPMRHENRLPLR